MTTFNDIFKSSFLENVSAVSVLDMAMVLALSFCIGLFIYFIYKKTFQGVMFSSSFGITLVSLTMISSILILSVTSNVVLSLGMVGALSIVRFRTAIKEPLDIAFLFWSIAVGIILAAGMFLLAVMGSICIGLLLLIFVNKKSFIHPYIVVIHCADADTEEKSLSFLKANCQKCTVKSKSVQKDSIEVNYEIRLKNDNTSFVNQLAEIEGVSNAILVSYNGEYMG